MHGGGTTRSSRKQVVFAHPFSLGRAPEVYPAGVYPIETSEAAHEGLQSVAYVRISTVMVIQTRTGTCDRRIEAAEFEEALKLDAQRSGQTD